jgi:hypothetical protein
MGYQSKWWKPSLQALQWPEPIKRTSEGWSFWSGRTARCAPCRGSCGSTAACAKAWAPFFLGGRPILIDTFRGPTPIKKKYVEIRWCDSMRYKATLSIGGIGVPRVCFTLKLLSSMVKADHILSLFACSIYLMG